jgi:hypothetical protein
MQAVAAIPVNKNKGLVRWLNASPVVFVAYVSVCAFVVYSCMYGFRKPFTVGVYNHVLFMGISYKVCLVIAQVLGYMLSKFYGIKFISGMKPERRSAYILICIGSAWITLLLFAIIPPPYNIICLFLNGLPLGLVWGWVFGFLEGRRTTELMGAVLATSFIFASGLAKTVGKWMQLSFHVSDWWMPFAAGAVFVVPLLVSVWLLSQTPPPSADDVAHRTVRSPMTGEERKQFIKKFGLSMVPVVIAYAVFTLVRDFCEDFSNELWIETGYQDNAAIFTQTGIIISLGALAIVGAFFLIKDNYKAFKMSHILIMAGVFLSLFATLLFNLHLINPFVWMILGTAGMYLGYLPFNCLYFERMISVYKIKGNVGFVMYIADAFGYLGTVVVLLVKEFIPIKYSWVHFFSFLFYAMGIIGVVLIGLSMMMHAKIKKQTTLI